MPSSKLKHLSIVVYLATAWRSWTQGIFLVTVTSDTEKCIANLMYYFTQFDFVVSAITIIYFLLDVLKEYLYILMLSFKKTVLAR